MTNTGKDLLRLEGVSYEYAGAKALESVSLSVRAGEIVALVGRNGAGKTTLLRCAAGWSPPTSGNVRVLGEELRYAERGLRSQMVLVTDTPPFYDDLTAREHVRFVLRANRVPTAEPIAERLLEQFGIAASANAYPSSFSRGMRYKLALVMALALRPRLLLLDEPFGPIDPVSADVLWDALRERAQDGACVLLSSHQLPRKADPDRYIVLEAGRVVGDGTASQLTRAESGPGLAGVLDHALGAPERTGDA